MAEQSVPDSAVKAAAGVMLRQYDEEYDASHLSWNDFADVAREVLEAAAPILVAAGRAQAAADILRYAEERFHPASGGRAPYQIAAGVAAAGEPEGAL